MECRVVISRQLSEYMQQMVDAEYPLIWIALDADQEIVFEHHDLTKVIAYANAHKNVDYISKYVDCA